MFNVEINLRVTKTANENKWNKEESIRKQGGKMSNYQFFASDEGLEEYKNSKIDAIKFMWNFIIKQASYNDELKCMRICVEDDLKLARMYTELKNCCYIEWHYSEKAASIIIEYIKEHLKYSKKIELWNVWEGEKEQTSIVERSVNDITTQDIKNIWGKDYFEHAECLVVKRNI